MGFASEISQLTFWEYVAFRDAWNAANNPDGPESEKLEAPSREDALAWFNSDV
tara:strand:- start:25472 stop:25630 length:159 start_codon:yes stop_codon:yes gene_type:complete